MKVNVAESVSFYRIASDRIAEPQLLVVASRENRFPINNIEVRAFVLGAQGWAGQPYSPVMIHGASAEAGSRAKLSQGYVEVRPSRWRGMGIGTICFSKTVEWAQRSLSPSGEIDPILLGSVECPDDAEQRQRFYKRFGFRWATEDFDPYRKQWPSEIIQTDDLKVPAGYPRGVSPVDDGWAEIQRRLQEIGDARSELETLRSEKKTLAVRNSEIQRGFRRCQARRNWATHLLFLTAGVALGLKLDELV
jgi:GNAT superfamily N-acetyltransferase